VKKSNNPARRDPINYYKQLWADKSMYLAIAFVAHEHFMSLKDATRSLLFMGTTEYCKNQLTLEHARRPTRFQTPTAANADTSWTVVTY